MQNASDYPSAYVKKLPEPNKVYVVDFFCGCGGMSYGFSTTRQSRLAFEVIAGIDIDPVALETFEKNVGGIGIEADIAGIGEDPTSLLRLIPNWDPEATRPLVFIGCAPCQGFSAMRKGDDRDDERNNLILSFAKIVLDYRPDVVLIENVREILGGRFSRYYQAASGRLRRAGYHLRESVLDMSGYGVPQRRRRAIVTGSLREPIEAPKAIFKAGEVLTVRHAIAHLRPIGSSETDPHDPVHRAPDHTDRLIEMFKAIPADGGDRRALPPELHLRSHKRLDKSDTPGFTDVYGRLRWNAPSVTITAKSRSASSGRFLHPEQHRNISIREAAILQGFPQVFSFCGSPTQQYRHIGEAVPPLFARFLAWSILDHFSPHQTSLSDILPKRGEDVRPRRRSNTFTLIDGFCGAGGIALGFKAAGIQSTFAFDVDADSVRTFCRNVSDKAEVFDVCDPNLAKRINRVLKGAPYCIVGGPPCQGFSHQRRGSSDDPRNRLVLRYADLISDLTQPPFAIVLENVTDLDLPRGRHILELFLGRLSTMGYVAFRHDMNSADYGLPQLRHRIVIVALQEAIAKCYRGPKALTPNRWVTVGEALADLPEPHARVDPLLWETQENHVISNEGELNRRRIAYVDMGYGRKSIPADLQLPCHATDYRGHRDVYGRLDWFSLARTVTGGFDSFTRGEYGHPFRHRSITPREAARLQGFPDSFVFAGNRAAIRRQIGNAVPPPMAYAIAKGIAAALIGAERDERADKDIHLRTKHAETVSNRVCCFGD
jgi:DNA (cytosine-5)-methyltransferase 1